MSRTANPLALQGAAHELGHAYADLDAGFRVRDITVDTSTGLGLTRLDLRLDDDTPTIVWRAWLVAVIAGHEAEAQWCRRHGGKADDSLSDTDFANFRRYRRRARLTESAARSEARKILRRQWRQIERHAPELAQRGRISPSRLQGGGWW